jgi:tryptophan 2,3-dioxygenase
MGISPPDYQNLELKELNYNSYLKVPELLQLQKLLSNPAHHDEMFFIVIHQAAELWFKLMLHETEGLKRAFKEDSISSAIKKLKRLTAVMDLQIKQINLLATLTPVEFAGFREHLRPASGFQSSQFRKIEFAYGIREDFFLQFFAKDPATLQELEQIRQLPSVYDEFAKCLARAGFAVPQEVLNREFKKGWQTNAAFMATLRGIYENPGKDYHWVLLFEGMLDFDEKFALWRSTHMLMIARTIGMKTGTGGSSGHKFLEGRKDFRFFPELWDLRTDVGPNY